MVGIQRVTDVACQEAGEMTVTLKAPVASPEVSGTPPARAEPRRAHLPPREDTASAWRESHRPSALTWTWVLYLPWVLSAAAGGWLRVSHAREPPGKGARNRLPAGAAPGAAGQEGAAGLTTGTAGLGENAVYSREQN